MNLIYFLILIPLILTGCVDSNVTAEPRIHSQQTSPKACIDSSLLILKKNHIQMIKLGDELRFNLKNKYLFINNTAQLKPSAYDGLNAVVEVLNRQKNLGINVLAYTISPDTLKPDGSLSQLRAEQVVNYLMLHGLKTQFIVGQSWSKDLRVWHSQHGTNRFNEESPLVSSIEIRTRLLRTEDME